MAHGSRPPGAASDAPDERSDPKSWPVRRAESFGGVVLRTGDQGAEVALIRTKNLKEEQVWALPKGTPEPGENAEATALREVREETGLDVEIVQPLEDVTYWFASRDDRARYRKTVHYFLMRAIGGDTGLHDDEVDEVRFVPLGEAARLVTYRSDRNVLKRAAESSGRL